MKKNINQIIIVFGLVVFLVGTLIACLSEFYGLIPSSTYLSVYPILIIAFSFAKSKTLNYAGYTINAISGLNALAVIITYGEIDDFSLLLPYVGLLIMMLASLVFILGLALNYFGFVKAGKSPESSNNKIELLRLYAELNKDEIITDEEFADVKSSVIKGNLKETVEKLNQIKELKKLFDEQVITKDEFINFNK